MMCTYTVQPAPKPKAGEEVPSNFMIYARVTAGPPSVIRRKAKQCAKVDRV